MTPVTAPARPRQLSLPGDLTRRDPGTRPDPGARLRKRRVPIGCSDGSGPTLGQEVSRVWEGLLAAGVADCLVCGAEMKRESDAATCSRCGSTLS